MEQLLFLKQPLNMTKQLKEYYSDELILQRLDGEITAYENVLEYLEQYE